MFDLEREIKGAQAVHITGALTFPLFRACVISSVRTYYGWTVFTSPDISYDFIRLTFMSFGEVPIAIIVSCVPTVSRFCQQYGPKLRKAVSPSADTHLKRHLVSIFPDAAHLKRANVLQAKANDRCHIVEDEENV